LDKPLPKTFVLELTRRCNHVCLYCYNAWKAPEINYAAGAQSELSTAEIYTIIDQLQDECHPETIALSGGEPLLREDLPEILTFIRGRDIVPIIITNGMLLTPEMVDATLQGGNYEITLLSNRPDVHDYLAGCPGAWDAAFESMLNVRRAKGNLIVAFIATRHNYMDLAKTAKLATALGAIGLMYNRINLSKFNMRNSALLLPTPAMIHENLVTLEEIAENYGLPISISVVCEPCVIDISQFKHMHFGYCPLGGEDSYFTIDPQGNLRICNHSSFILGNLLRERFVDIYNHHPYLNSFRNVLPNECKNCKPEWKEVCRGGCKAAAEQCYGTIERVDPFVTMSKQ
jgi:radical SAM protein with 4Fe4S-binding SPASM domain